MVVGKQSYSSINALLNRRLEEKQILIAVHRGTPGANIIENTIPALKNALLHKGDMVEIDVIRSTDGVFYTFHDGQEKRLLGADRNIKTMDSETIDGLRFLNGIGHKIAYRVERLSDVLNAFKGEVLINIDRSWDVWTELLPALDQYHMLDQLVLKAPVKREYLDLLNNHSSKYMFMPIIKTPEEIDLVLSYKDINLVGMELLAETEQDPLFRDEMIADLKAKQLFVWVNAITLDDDMILYAGYDDNISIINHPDEGWGKLIEKNVDVIQTDWPAILADYRDRKLSLR